MLKIVKVKKTKKGFTLLETLLSVALLVIISTMLMNGFMSTMNYSHNTSVYWKSAGGNYAAAMSDLAEYAAHGSSGDNAVKSDSYKKLSGETNDATLYFTGLKGKELIITPKNDAGQRVINLKVFKETKNNTGLNDNVADIDEYEEYWNAGGGDSSYADNRYAFVYYPACNNSDDAKHPGEIRIYKKNGTDELSWGYKITKDDGTKVFHYAFGDDNPQKSKVNK